MAKATCTILGIFLILISILGFLGTPAFKSDTWASVVELIFGLFGLAVGLWRGKTRFRQ